MPAAPEQTSCCILWKKKKNPLSNITHPGWWLRNWLQGKRSLLPTARSREAQLQIAPLYRFSLGMSYTCWYEHTVVQCCTHYACNWGRLLHHDTRALNFYPFVYKSAASCVLNSATSKSRKCLVYMSSEIDSAQVRSQWAVISLCSVSTAEWLWDMKQTVLVAICVVGANHQWHCSWWIF